MKGKVFGVVFGLLAGGILGALLGLILGHWIDQIARLITGPSAARKQQAIIEKCFELMGCICKADGRVTQDEIQAAESMMRKLRLIDDARQAAIKAFNRGKTPGFNHISATAELKHLCGGRLLWLRLCLEILLSGAAADGRLDPAERKMLLEIAEGLGIPGAEFEQMLALLTGGFGASYGQAGGGASYRPPRDNLADAYKVLGISSDASDADAKKAYRRLMSKHHPDKIAAQELPEAMRQQAEEQVRKIRAAWDTVSAARGL